MRTRRDEATSQQERFAVYLDRMAQAAGHADRIVPMQNYVKGLLLPLERKSVEPMAARLAPGNVRQMHQSLHHIVAEAAWSDEAVLAEVRRQVLPSMTRQHPLAAWIVDDTGFPKKGTHSVGVTRQYCGQVGKQDNCRVAVSVSVTTGQASLPLAYRLYLPEIWAQDRARRSQVGVPEEIEFQTKQEIALDQIRSLVAEEVPRAPVLADAAYGNDHGFREGLEALGFSYAVGIQSSTSVWPPGSAPLPAKARGVMGRPPKLLQRDEKYSPLSVKELALCLSPGDLRRVSWREGTRGTMASRFAALRVRVAHRDYERSQPRPEQWLLFEWPKTEKEPTKYWLSNLPELISLRRLVATAKLRWRIERDYEELKQELGLGHYEGRNWRGFHHHATLCIAAYGFLEAERCLFSPGPHSRPVRAADIQLRLPRLPRGATPRGAAGQDRTA
ncbi:MAG TPA: IS701 family transposase [Terracidiphilus sp.]|jgi:SRSO17 transposase|nr:IS701 family transposase [Terracidiphilus sp.]